MGESSWMRGVYVASGVGALLRFAVDRQTGELSCEGETEAGLCPSFVAFHPRGPWAFVIDERAASVRSFAFTERGKPSQIGCVDSGGAGPAYISIDRAGGSAFVANYAGGTVAVLAVSEGGALAPPTQVIRAGTCPHAIAVDRANRRVAVPVLGDDAVFQYGFDAARRVLEPAPVPHTSVPVGAGPRHIDFHPRLPVAYVVHEHSSELTAFVMSDSGFIPLVTCSTLPLGAERLNNTGSDVHVAPSGRFVFASNRGHDSIAVFALDERGVPTPRAHAKTRGSTPRNFCLIDEGALLLVANLRSDSVTAFAVDRASGALTPLTTTKGIPMPYWIGAPLAA
jgi:6-phosphogluconolactonase